MTMNEQIAAIGAVIVSIGTAVGSAINAAKQNRDAKSAQSRVDEFYQTMIDQGIEIRDLKSDLNRAKEHTAECERDRKDMAVQLSRMEGSLATMERLATMHDKVPAPFEAFIRQIADSNSLQTSTRMREELAEMLAPMVSALKALTKQDGEPG